MSKILVFLFFSSVSFATSFYIRPFSEFTQTAPNILRGTLSNVRVENSVISDGGRTIYTYANLAVKERIKGDVNAPNITVRKTGGTKDGVTLEIPSSPEFTEGEDTVMYLSEQREDKSYEVVSLELGKFGLAEKNGKEVLTGGLFSYARPSDHEKAEHSVQAGDLSENSKSWSLQDLRELVKKETERPSAPIATPAQVAETKTNFTHPDSTPLQEQATQVQTKDFSDTSHENSAIAYLYGAIGLLIAIGIFRYLKRG
jgi:hypothetical protein